MEISNAASATRLHAEMRTRCTKAMEAASDINNADQNFSDEVKTIRAALSDLQWVLENIKQEGVQ